MNATHEFPGTAPRQVGRQGAIALVLGVLGAVLAPPTVATAASPATPGAAVEVIRETTDRLFGALKADRDAIAEDATRADAIVDDIVSPRVDMQFIAKLVLGKHEGEATPEQVERFTAELKKLLLRTYGAVVSEQAEARVEFLPEPPAQDGPYAAVRTRLHPRSGSSITVDYRLRGRNGEWKVYDFIVEGVSLVTTYRSNFESEISRNGIEGLVQALVARNARRGS